MTMLTIKCKCVEEWRYFREIDREENDDDEQIWCSCEVNWKRCVKPIPKWAVHWWYARFDGGNNKYEYKLLFFFCSTSRPLRWRCDVPKVSFIVHFTLPPFHIFSRFVVHSRSLEKILHRHPTIARKHKELLLNEF